MAWCALRPICNVYIALHQETDSASVDWDLLYPSSLPLCNVHGHRPDSIPHTHNDSASTSFAPIASLVPAPIVSSEVPSLFVPAPPHANESITDVQPLDNFQPQTTCETTTESLSIPATSGIIIPRPTSATSTFVSPLSSTPPSPSTAVALQHNSDPLAHSYPPNLPPSAAYGPVLGSILPTRSHRPIMVTVTPSASPGPTSAPDLGAAAEDDGSQMPGLRGNEDALDLRSANRAIDANTTPALGLPPQLPSLPSVTDSNRDQYDIV
ncbi:hypothetical protein EDB83DRAFT_2415672 [Lactarius deliciosus]|nr:hypothetical protein EDB83DRAFT_2415672 [Lactarius deliciosus]